MLRPAKIMTDTASHLAWTESTRLASGDELETAGAVGKSQLCNLQAHDCWVLLGDSLLRNVRESDFRTQIRRGYG